MRYLGVLLLGLLFFAIGTPVSAATKTHVLDVPSPACVAVGNQPCIQHVSPSASPNTVSPATGGGSGNGSSPSSQPSIAQNISSAPSVSGNPSPSSAAPCSTSQSSLSSQSTGTVSALSRHHHGKWHHSTGGGFLQQFIQWLWQLLQQLFQKLGIQLPNISVPCGSGSGSNNSPSGSPAGGGSGGSGTPSGQPKPSSNVSQAPAPSGSGSTGSSGFLTTSGTKLMLNGKQYKSLSFDISPLGDCWSSNWSTSQMDTAFAAMPAGSLVRFFAPDDSGDSASFVESIVKEADKYNIHLIIALADADTDNNCDTDDAQGNGKSAAYYTDAIQSGSNYENWVKSVVPPLANDPGVGIWEISNEPVHAGATLSSGVSMSTFQTYIDTAAAYIRSFDKNHLVSIAPADLDEFGGASGAESLFKNLDVIDDHDYAWDYNNKSEISGDFSTLQTVSKSLNKPFMIDEAGVEGGSSCGSNGLSLQDRSTYLITKANDYLSSSGGASALVIWLYTGDSSGGCVYENINTSDPVMAAVKSYQMPN